MRESEYVNSVSITLILHSDLTAILSPKPTFRGIFDYE